MNDANQPLRDLFDRIDAKELAAMRDRREEESLNLDFKRMDLTGEPSEADKRNLRDSISGFANAAGGIILWGVESKTPDDKRDRSRFQSLAPVKDGDRAVVRFHELTATATQPPVNGVVHRAITVDGGFVVKTFVPASDGGPHRTNEEKGQYFRRDADAFRPMQHHEIADMFGRRARPVLQLHCFQSLPRGGRVLAIQNVGRALARHLCLVLRPRQGSHTPSLAHIDERNRSMMRGASPHPDDGRFEFVRSEEIIHPGRQLEVCHLASSSGEDFHRLDFAIYAESIIPVEGTLRVYGRNGWKLETPEERMSSVS